MDDFKEQLKIAIEKLKERSKDWKKEDWSNQIDALKAENEQLEDNLFLFKAQRKANIKNDKVNKHNEKVMYEYEYKDKDYRKAILKVRLKSIDNNIKVAENNININKEKIKYCNLQLKN